MKLVTLLGSIVLLSVAHAGPGHKNHKHKSHEAHVHGSATLNIAFDQQNGKVEFKAASEGILGFEHTPKSDGDKKKLADAIQLFETSMGKMVKFEDGLGCQFTKSRIEMIAEEKEEKKDGHSHKAEGEHSDFVADFSVTCKKDPKGSKLTLDWTSIKGLKDIDVTILIADMQKSIELKRKPMTLDLK